MDQETGSALKLWVVMNRAMRGIEDHLRRQVEPHGLSFTEFGVLEVLLHKGRLTIGEVGSRVLLTSGSMTYVIDKLEQRGLIRRRACGEDRRVIYVGLTEEGRALIETVFAEHAALIADLMGVLPHEERVAVADALKRLGLSVKARREGEAAAKT